MDWFSAWRFESLSKPLLRSTSLNFRPWMPWQKWTPVPKLTLMSKIKHSWRQYILLGKNVFAMEVYSLGGFKIWECGVKMQYWGRCIFRYGKMHIPFGKMRIPEPRETSHLLSKISEAVESVSKTGAVISEGIWKISGRCCGDPTHGLTSGETPVTLNRRIMEINTFFERSAIFNNGLLKTGTVTMFDLALPVTPTSRPMCRHSTDMVHPTMMQLRRLCATLLAVREHLIVGRVMNAQSWSIEPSLGFEDWRTGYIKVAGTGSDRQIPRPSTHAARSYEDLDWTSFFLVTSPPMTGWAVTGHAYSLPGNHSR